MPQVRAWLTVLALSFALGSHSPALAQTPDQQAQTPPAEALAAGEALFNAIVFDSGVLDMLIETVRAEMMPGFRDELMDSPLYRNASPQRQQAVAAFLETVPDVLHRELAREMAQIGRQSAPRIAVLMSPQDLRDTAAFLRDPALRPLWQELLGLALDPKLNAPSFPDWSGHPELAAFDSTPAGRAFAEQREALEAILDEEVEAGLTRAEPALYGAIMRGICDALAEECPSHLRGGVDRT